MSLLRFVILVSKWVEGHRVVASSDYTPLYSLEVSAFLWAMESALALLGLKLQNIQLTNIFRLAMLAQIMVQIYGIMSTNDFDVVLFCLHFYYYLAANYLIKCLKGIYSIEIPKNFLILPTRAQRSSSRTPKINKNFDVLKFKLFLMMCLS